MAKVEKTIFVEVITGGLVFKSTTPSSQNILYQLWRELEGDAQIEVEGAEGGGPYLSMISLQLEVSPLEVLRTMQ